jgi:NADH:ubiquinone oxidoreductase subunit 3 (subunit A)
MTLDIIEAPSPNFDARTKVPDMLVLHYTGMESGEAALARLCDPEARVSSHYLVEEDGRIFRLVPEERRAWHAGVSVWKGEEGVNHASIGIEIVNPGHEFGYRPFPEAQVAAVIALAMVGGSLLAARQKPYAEKLSAYECGFEAFDDARRRFDVRFYLVAILFIIFDLEVAFLFPWAVSMFDLSQAGMVFAFWSMMVFLGVLTVGFIYEWKKGALEWE